MGDLTSFLIPDSSFAEGAARLLDVTDSLNDYNHSANASEADANAIWADCAQVGRDLEIAMNKVSDCRSGQNEDVDKR